MTVLVVDDHPLVRMGIISTLSTEIRAKDIKEASNISEAMSAMSNNSPDVTIVDLNLGRDNGLDLITKARQNHNKSKFIVLTSSSRREDFERAQEMDVDGYILKDAFTDEIIHAFQVVSRGRKFYDPTVISLSLNTKSPYNDLTSREKEVLKELSKGLNNMQIAKALFITENTVKKHISSILDKLGLSSRTEAALLINKSGDTII